MNVSVDSNFLSLLLHPDAKPPLDPATGAPVSFVSERMASLVAAWNESHDRIVVSTPVIAEFLVLAGEQGNDYLVELNNLANIYIRPFDLRAAIELASFELMARKEGSKRGPLGAEMPWQKVKIDRQVVAIAKVNNVSHLYADDKGVRALAETEGMKVTASWQLPLPPSKTPLLENSGPPVSLS